MGAPPRAPLAERPAPQRRGEGSVGTERGPPGEANAP